MQIIWWILAGFLLLLFSLITVLFIYDRFWQNDNIVKGQFPVMGRFRYLFHDLRPYFRQYFGDDNAFTPRLIIDWILNVSNGKSGYFAFDTFDTTHTLHDGNHQMIHAPSPLNEDEMEVVYPTLGRQRKQPFPFQSYFYRSAMSLGALGFEATAAMAAACAQAKAPFNTGEGGFSVHHIPKVKFQPERKFFKSIAVPQYLKFIWVLSPGVRLKNQTIDWFGSWFLPSGKRDLYLFDTESFVFYTINWDADLEHFPKPEDLTDEFGFVIFQIGSGLYGLRKANDHGEFEFNWDRFKKISTFCRGIEIKLAQGAKQTGGILKAGKNTPVIADIRGVKSGIDLISPNRFPFYEKGQEKAFLEFCKQVSDKAGGKPIGAKIVISNRNNVEPLVVAMSQNPDLKLDWLTIDGGDGGSGAAPIALGILFGKRVYEAISLVDETLKKYNLRDKVNILASAKLYAPHMSARAMALGADAIGNARSIMIAGGCIRAGLCSGEHGKCPVGMATMDKSRRRAYAQTWSKKVQQINNYIHAHNHGLIQVAAICGVKSPSLLNNNHIATSD